MTQDKFARLPVYAREHIAMLERDHARLKARVDELTTWKDCPPSNVWLSTGGSITQDDYAPSPWRQARFQMGPRRFIDCYQLEWNGGSRLMIMSSFSPVLIKPSASNCFEVTLDQR